MTIAGLIASFADIGITITGTQTTIQDHLDTHKELIPKNIPYNNNTTIAELVKVLYSYDIEFLSASHHCHVYELCVCRLKPVNVKNYISVGLNDQVRRPFAKLMYTQLYTILCNNFNTYRRMTYADAIADAARRLHQAPVQQAITQVDPVFDTSTLEYCRLYNMSVVFTLDDNNVFMKHFIPTRRATRGFKVSKTDETCGICLENKITIRCGNPHCAGGTCEKCYHVWASATTNDLCIYCRVPISMKCEF